MARAASKATLSTSFHATVHCLSGCAIGECAGLVIGVSLGLPPLQIIILATGLAYLSGFALGAYPVMKRQSIGFVAAIKIIWIGEVVSIGVMEIAMNATDYYMGGMTVDSIFSFRIFDCDGSSFDCWIRCGLAGQLLVIEP